MFAPSLAQDQETGKMLVIDGQQRLLSLSYFYSEEFKPNEESKIKRIFKLSNVKKQFSDKTYSKLDTKDRINLDNAVTHATVVKQETPTEDDTSIYHIFERLNSGGRKLTPQEIRVAVYHGKLIETAKQLNDLPQWRSIFGQHNDRMKDVELILRFLAVFESHNNYVKPMVEFINIFCSKNRNPSSEKMEYFKELFTQTITLFTEAVAQNLFRPARALNVALFESAMVGLATRLVSGIQISKDSINSAYQRLIDNQEFNELISQSTSDVRNLKRRIEIAIAEFTEV